MRAQKQLPDFNTLFPPSVIANMRKVYSTVPEHERMEQRIRWAEMYHVKIGIINRVLGLMEADPNTTIEEVF